MGEGLYIALSQTHESKGRVLQSSLEGLQEGCSDSAINDPMIDGKTEPCNPLRNDLPVFQSQLIDRLTQAQDATLGRVENGGEEGDLELSETREGEGAPLDLFQLEPACPGPFDKVRSHPGNSAQTQPVRLGNRWYD